jgi:hypothetical protein
MTVTEGLTLCRASGLAGLWSWRPCLERDAESFTAHHLCLVACAFQVGIGATVLFAAAHHYVPCGEQLAGLSTGQDLLPVLLPAIRTKPWQ